MIAQHKYYSRTQGILYTMQRAFALACLTLVSGAVFAASNEIQSISSTQQGTNVVVKVALKNPVTTPPIGFSITSPARIALDFADTANATGKGLQEIGLGDVRNVNVVQAGERSRLVFNMQKSLNYATTVEGNVVVVTIEGSGGPATPLTAAGLPVPQPVVSTAISPQALRDIDFRRGSNGEGRVVIDLPSNQIAVDVRQVGNRVEVDFLKASLPQVLRRRLDVADFGTPVDFITTQQQGDNVRMLIEPKGAWEHSAYQSDTQLVIEVKPIREEPNRLGMGTQNYRGEKLSLNFQNVDVRAVLQVIADFTGLNIITSDTVSGNLTLRLKDVPWDQALDIVMQAKGLDMRKNGTVLWIAPRDELLTKEKLELEQRAQIAELEPVRTETFQLNYQKAEAFKQVFGIDSGNRSILSKRGSAVVDPRTNQLFVTDIASKLDEVRALVQKTDIASRQVMIEARIVEATDTFSRNLGAKLSFGSRSGSYQLGGNQSAAGTGGALPTLGNSAVNLPAGAISGNAAGSVALTLFNSAATRFIGLELSALEADGKGKIISSPRVITADQLKALIEQGEELPYQQATSSGATSIAFKKANLKLEVTPQITPDGNVILDVDVTKDSVGRDTPVGLAIDTKHVRTQVLIENGGTVVIGGIFTQTDTDQIYKVPLIGDIPVVGNLFKTTGKERLKTELLIFLSPKILNDKVAIR
ncbi:MAG: type IV pilus secretin PilQ [Oxalicibacterium faecigallinarum]|uniref:type IV pilus secretin PilQ n=1 Tax=Oxalicibacterium faecigallinarum TaxID=573741 RepID=UPI0028081E4F|nr:type IV pilus secretin PilQ [Oxalicibacterium faecigallinarum]MDQ7968592.1 type IV pilus secretin PilQ [Oxalicibacterium faecigallinarum]